MFVLLSCNKVDVGHSCKYRLCPYKNVSPERYEDKVLEYHGTDDCISYWLDLYHLQYPTYEDYQLEELLNK